MAIRRHRILSLVTRLLKEKDVTEPPVPIKKLARLRGARVLSRPLESDMSGFLYREKDVAIIGINSHHAEVRQRFTVAHELGHLLLHKKEDVHIDRKSFVKLRNNLSSQGTDQDEVEANLFAAEILMPRDFLKEDIENIGEVDLLDSDILETLAKKYLVSTQALTLRLENLRFLKH